MPDAEHIFPPAYSFAMQTLHIVFCLLGKGLFKSADALQIRTGYELDPHFTGKSLL